MKKKKETKTMKKKRLLDEFNSKVLLFINPNNKRADTPLIDKITIKMFNMLVKHIYNTGVIMRGSFLEGESTLGLHECICGAVSRSCDFMLDDGYMTNFLCVHYVAYHREECPDNQLKIIENFNIDDTKIDSNFSLYFNDILLGR